MDVAVTLWHIFDRTPDGVVWTDGQFPYSFWTRYLEVFDGVRVVGRLRDVPSVPESYHRADGERVSFAAVPVYRGVQQYLTQLKGVRAAALAALSGGAAVIMRGSSQNAACLEGRLRGTGQPYGIEVVGDPADAFAPGAFNHPWRPVLRWVFVRREQRLCAGACGAAYVTRETLQRRYPCPTYSTSYSSIELKAEDFAAQPRLPRAGHPFTVVTVGSLSHPIKGVDVLIDAVGLLARQGADVHLVAVGEGRLRPELEGQARSLDLNGRIRFAGQLSPREVRATLDAADLFVLASRVEGLPRAMIEAMARGLPCLGTSVGGIPELLPGDALVRPNQVGELAGAIRRAMESPTWLAQSAARNLAVAGEYREDILRARRVSFYRHVRETTESWTRSWNRQ